MQDLRGRLDFKVTFTYLEFHTLKLGLVFGVYSTLLTAIIICYLPFTNCLRLQWKTALKMKMKRSSSSYQLNAMPAMENTLLVSGKVNLHKILKRQRVFV